MSKMLGKAVSAICYGVFLFLAVLLVAFTQYEWMWTQ